MKDYVFDAIVVGSGISGGWAAKELAEKGLTTLILERGHPFEHVTDYTTALLNPWDFTHRNSTQFTSEERTKHPVAIRAGVYTEATRHLWANEQQNPYTEINPFDWVRGYQVGGRSMLWGKQCYRLSDLDFAANANDGVGVDWPIRYKDLAPWYDYVERFAGISGNKDGIAHLPDGQFLPPMAMNSAEQLIAQRLRQHYPERQMIIGRCAHLTQPQPHHLELGRGQCQYRNLCSRGCPFGAYFSTNSATLPAALRTKRIKLRPHAVVNSIIIDSRSGRAKGVRVIDAITHQWTDYHARLIFLCASTLNSTAILLNSAPGGLGNASDQLGRNLMDHVIGAGAYGMVEGLDDQYYYGRRPNGVFIPRFRNVTDKHSHFLRGYGYQGEAKRGSWQRGSNQAGFGADFKERLTQPGPWSFGMGGFAECLPHAENRVWLNKEVLDAWGQPTLAIDCQFRENELALKKDMIEQAAEMLEATGLKHVGTYDQARPGLGIHEMGTARMGRDPKTSVLNGNNQLHEVKNVFVTDGACMTSSAWQNPSLTYMALTARAANFAVQELKRGNL